jgi:hypothetical protein
MQKRASAGFSWPHWGQRTVDESLITFPVYNASRNAILPRCGVSGGRCSGCGVLGEAVSV